MGVVPAVPTVYEVLEELAITAQQALAGSAVPFCAFNGGNDVFVDVRLSPVACTCYLILSFFIRALTVEANPQRHKGIRAVLRLLRLGECLPPC